MRVIESAELEAVICKFSPLVRTVVSGIIGGRRRDIEEVVSDVFVDYWRAEKFDTSDNGAKNLLVTIARRRAINRLKSLGRDVVAELDEELCAAELTEDEVCGRLENDAIAAAVAGLDPPDDEIFTRRYFYCQSVKEIARAMGKKPKYIENRLFYAKKALREALVARGIDYGNHGKD